jgi:hypothetical protein
MTAYLKYRFEPEEEMGPKEDEEYKKTKCLEKKKSIPQDIRLRVYKLPFKKNTDGKIDCIPQADEKISLSPNFWYPFNKFHLR